MASGARRTSSQEVLHTLFSILPASLELEKSSLLQAIRLKSLDHWPTIQIDHTVRKSFELCFTIINGILNKIFDHYKLTFPLLLSSLTTIQWITTLTSQNTAQDFSLHDLYHTRADL
jgi:hypothetical protein